MPGTSYTGKVFHIFKNQTATQFGSKATELIL